MLEGPSHETTTNRMAKKIGVICLRLALDSRIRLVNCFLIITGIYLYNRE
jgi:hypothetical protein